MRPSPAQRESRRRAPAPLPTSRPLMGQRGIGEVDEHPLAISKRRHPHERADRLDVASGLADETPYVALRELDLDRDGASAALERLDVDLFRLLGQRFRDVLDQRAVVHARAGRPRWTLTPVAA